MTLFSPSDLKPKARAPERDRRRRRISTGAPRLMESSAERLDRERAEAWEVFLDVIRQSALARLDLFKGLAGKERISCPWGRLVTCDVGCRCGGSTTVTIGFLRDHYTQITEAIAQIVRPTAAGRSS